jgi:type II secretory pathway component PulK
MSNETNNPAGQVFQAALNGQSSRRVADIVVGERHRTDMGDIDLFAVRPALADTVAPLDVGGHA